MSIYDTLRKIYNLKYFLINVIAFFAYYFIVHFIVSFQERVFLIVNPFLYYLIYPMLITSSILLTIAIYSIKNTKHNKASFTASGLGTITTLIGSLVVSCACSVPILFSLTAIGISSAGIISLSNLLSSYSIELLLLFIFLNLLLIIYYLNKLSKPYCNIKKNIKENIKKHK